jgi:hypothetical protein
MGIGELFSGLWTTLYNATTWYDFVHRPNDKKRRLCSRTPYGLSHDPFDFSLIFFISITSWSIPISVPQLNLWLTRGYHSSFHSLFNTFDHHSVPFIATTVSQTGHGLHVWKVCHCLYHSGSQLLLKTYVIWETFCWQFDNCSVPVRLNINRLYLMTDSLTENW